MIGALSAAGLATSCALLARRSHLRRRTARHLGERFAPVPETGLFRESTPVFWSGGSKVDHGVLLIHGYSASVDEFRHLVPALREAGIAFHAPRLTGFGASSTRILAQVSADDWQRDVLLAHDQLACAARRVSVVGHSMGGVLAMILARHRPVDKLVLCSPCLAPVEGLPRLLRLPVVRQAVELVDPWFAKPVREGRVACVDTLDPAAVEATFHMPALPLRSLLALWDLLDRIDPAAVRASSVDVLWGAHERTVRVDEARRLLERSGLGHRTAIFRRSAHNLLEDHEREDVSRHILSVLRG